VKHVPVPAAPAGRDLTLEIAVETAEPVRRVSCYHRPANQTLAFTRHDMACVRPGAYRVTIPGDEVESGWDLMLFFELLLETGEGVRWPDWRVAPPYLVTRTD
jgi:hypothetical protein